MPSPETETLVCVHGADPPGLHSFTGVPDAGFVPPVDAVSLDLGEIVCVTPWPPVDVSADAVAASTYRPLTTPLVPTTSAPTAEVDVPPEPLTVVSDDPAAPETTVALDDVADVRDPNRALYEPGVK